VSTRPGAVVVVVVGPVVEVVDDEVDEVEVDEVLEDVLDVRVVDSRVVLVSRVVGDSVVLGSTAEAVVSGANDTRRRATAATRASTTPVRRPTIHRTEPTIRLSLHVSSQPG